MAAREVAAQPASASFPHARSSVESPKALLRRRRAEILARTAAHLLKGRDPDTEVLPTLYEALAAERLVDASLGFIVTEGSKTMNLGFIKGFPADVVKRCVTLDFGQAVCGTVAATRRPMHVTNIQQSLDPLADLVRSAGMTAYACEPLIVGDRMLGTFSFASRSRRSFDAEDLLFFRAIAKHVALARDRMLSKNGQPAPPTRIGRHCIAGWGSVTFRRHRTRQK